VPPGRCTLNAYPLSGISRFLLRYVAEGQGRPMISCTDLVSAPMPAICLVMQSQLPTRTYRACITPQGVAEGVHLCLGFRSCLTGARTECCSRGRRSARASKPATKRLMLPCTCVYGAIQERLSACDGGPLKTVKTLAVETRHSSQTGTSRQVAWSHVSVHHVAVAGRAFRVFISNWVESSVFESICAKKCSKLPALPA
jgi:hypothetical protein